MKYQYEESLGMLSALVSKQLGVNVENEFRKSGFEINSLEWAIISSLMNKGSLTQKQLVESSGKNKVAVKRVLDGLERKRFVKRTVLRKDKRFNQIEITKSGKLLYDELVRITENVLDRTFVNIQEKDIEICANVLKSVLINAK